MAYIPIPDGVAGIRGPMLFRPETAKHLNELVEVLLRGPHTLSQGERELIAAFVSSRNDCFFCHTIHGAIAARHLGGDEALVDCVKLDFEGAEISERSGRHFWRSRAKFRLVAKTSRLPMLSALARLAPPISKFTMRS